MPIEEEVMRRVRELIGSGQNLRIGDEHGQTRNEHHAQQCRGWLAAASNIAQQVIPDADSAYRRDIERIGGRNHGYVINGAVGEVVEILTNLYDDVQRGLVSSVANHARAEVFDDFLDHAKAYAKEGRKNESGVIGGVVFEDTLRQVCRKAGIAERGRALDELISELASRNLLTGTKAKRARVAAHVRTKATHAQWDEFDDNDVETAIQFTEELIGSHLDS